MDLPDPVRLAQHLIGAGAPITVVGGAAAWLQAPESAVPPRDLDLVPLPVPVQVANAIAAAGWFTWIRAWRRRGSG